MQYPKQSDTTFQSQDKTFKREEQPISERERAKLEGRNEAEDEHMSQPSTLHSLGNLDESISPGNTPRSMEILQKGFHKATDTIAQGVEIVKNILTYSGEKATQAKENVGEKASGFEGDIKQKAEQAKSKLTEEFGEEIQPEKDLDPEMKEQVKEVNEEIKHHPHGEEQVVEGQGHAQDKPKSFGSKESDVSSQKTGEMKEKLGSKIENLKEGSKEMVDKAAGKLDEMKEKTSQQTQPLKEQAQNLPGKGYEKKEQSREKDITKDDDLRTVSKDILDKALDKIEEIKDNASQKGEQIKQDVKQASSQISEKAEQKTSQFSESKSQSQSHHVEAQPGDQPLTKEAKEEILDLAQQITDKVQELKASGQLSTEQKWQSSHFESQTGSTSLSDQEGHEHHHHLSAESPSFVPTKQSHQLYEKVKEGLDESVPLTEKIEEFEHKKPAGSSQFQESGQPAMESLKQGAQNISNKISEKVQDVKGSLASSGQQSSGSKQESYQPQERGQALSGQKENLQSQERGQPALDTLKQGAQDLSNKFSQKVQDIKSNLAPSGQQSSEFKQESSQYQERGQPLSSQMKQGAQEAQSKFYEKKEDFKDKLAPSGQRPSGYQQEGFQSQERGQPLSSQIKQGVQEASNKLSEKMEDVKDKFTPSGQKPSESKQESFQSQERGQPLSGQMKQGVQEAQSKFYEKKEDFKDKLAPSGQQPSEFKQDFSQSGSQSQEKPATEQLKENVEQASEKLSEKVQEVKQDITQKKEEILEERKPLVDKIMGRIHGVTDDFHQRVEGVKSAFRIEEKPQEEQSQREPLVDIVQKGITDMTSKISHNIEAVKSKVMPAHHERSSQETLHFRPAKPEEGVSLKEKISQSVSDIKNRFKSEKGEEKFHKVDADEGFYETVEEYRQGQSEPPLVSSNPYETLGTKNLTLAQPLYPKDVVGGDLKELTSNVDTENLHLNEEYIYHPTMIEKIKEGFKAKFGKGEEEEEIAEEVQEGSQTLKQKISGRIESLKDKFHHGKEEVQQQATEKISEKKPLEQPLEAAKQEGKSLKGKAEEKISENKPFEQPLEQLSGASESKSFKEVIGAPFQAIKGKFHHEREEVQQQASEKISEKKSLEQPLEAAKQEGKSLKGKVEEKTSESKPIEKPFEQPLEQLSEAAESGSFKEVIGAPFQSIKGKLHHEKEEVQQQASEKISEVKPLEKSLEQPLEADKQEGKSFKGKAEEKISENKPFEQPLKQFIEASESKTLKEVISAPFQSISGKIAVEVGSIQGKYLSGKKQVKEGISQKFEEIQSLDQPSGQLGQQESAEFHTVKEGIRETVSELKEEQSVEPLVSSNPFVPLKSKGGDIAQPLNPQDIVGGDLQDLTQGVGEENIETEESSLAGESKSLLQKISGGFHEGLESMKAKFRKEKEPLEEQDINISEKFNITKEKAESGFTHYYKENMALLGFMKDIEDKCKSSQNEGNENA